MKNQLMLKTPKVSLKSLKIWISQLWSTSFWPNVGAGSSQVGRVQTLPTEYVPTLVFSIRKSSAKPEITETA